MSTTTFNLEEQLRKLKLDKKKCPMAKLNEIMSLLKTNVNFKPLSENYYSGSTYLVEAEGFNMMAHGVSALNPYDAQKNAAINLFEKLHYRYCIMSPISNVACKTNSEKNNNIENRKQTIHIDSNVSNLQKFIKPTATIVNTKCNSLIVPPSSDYSSKLSLENKKTTDNCDYRLYTLSSSTPRLNTPLSPVSIDYSASKTTDVPDYFFLLQEKCLNNNWPSLNIFSEFKYISGLPEFTVTCTVLYFKAIGKGLSLEKAKYQAAEKMYNSIKNLSNENIYDTELLTDIIPLDYLLHNVQFRDGKKIFTANSLKILETFYNTWIEFRGSYYLDKYEIGTVNVLENIAKAESFTVKYIVIPQDNNNGKVNVMLQISTVPVTVQIGQGNTVQKAKEDAAFTMLINLREKYNFAK